MPCRRLSPHWESELATGLDGVLQQERELCTQLLVGVSHPSRASKLYRVSKDRQSLLATPLGLMESLSSIMSA